MCHALDSAPSLDVDSLHIATQCCSPAARVGTNIRPPGGGSNRGVAALRLTFPPAYGPRLGRSSTGGAAPPRPPRAAPPVRPSAHGPLPLVAQRGGPGRGGLSPLSAAIGGNTRQARIACEISRLVLEVFIKRLFGKRSASGRRRGPCGQGGAVVGACGQAGRFASLSTCAHVGPACPAGRTSAVVAKAGFQDVRLFGFRLLKILRERGVFSRGTPEALFPRVRKSDDTKRRKLEIYFLKYAL